MVDAIVSFAVQRLGDFLIQEAALLRGVKKEVVWLQNELRWMRSFLKDAEQRQDGDERIRLWTCEVRDIAYCSEDVIDTFIFKVKGIGNSERRSLSSFAMKCFCICQKADLYDVGKAIEALKTRVIDVARKIDLYGLKSIADAQEGTNGALLRDLRITTSYEDEDEDEEHIVGFDDDAQLLEAKLFLEEPRRSVISILGMGGLGKTTLARKLYNNNIIKFDRHAWVCVSQEWKTRDLLERLIKSFKKLTKQELEQLEMMKDYDMEQYLRKLLEGYRYLAVIDDVWQREAWESLRRAFPDKKNGSRIIITTRKEAVAELSDQRTYVHKLRFLRPGESWQLFCTRAFPESNGVCPPDMEKLGEEMVVKCGGLPLAIIVLGGLLSRKQFHEWPVVKERIWRELKNNSIHISSLLALSYKDLTHELKSCFLYLGLFPEDFEIDVEKLIQLWVAEEFITQAEEGLDLEEVAENYLKELIGRSLIQVVDRNWRMISTCRVHDLLRDLAVTKAKELNFLHISDETTYSAPSSMVSSFKRIAFRSGFETHMSLDQSHQQVRTLSFLNNELLDHNSFNHGIVESLMTFLYTRFRLLRVLDLEGVGIVTEATQLRLFEAVGKLIHLRYLGLKKTMVKELPESIGNLQALQTLDVSNNDRRIMLPKQICKLKQLRHLIGDLKTEEGRVCATPLLFEELTNLQSLKDVDIDGFLKQKEGRDLALNAFAKLQNLKFLSVRFYSHYMLSVQPLFNCKHLIGLKIDGGIGKLPKEMHKFLPKLKYLNLVYSRFEEDPMPALEMLPNLLVLELGAIEVKVMTCTATGFCQLEDLKLSNVSDVTKLQVEEGAMPRLRALTMDDERKKRFLPERLRHLPDRDVLNWELGR